MKVVECMSNEPVILEEDASIIKAAKKMRSASCGVLPIGSDCEHIIGVLTDRDMVTRAVADEKDLSQTAVKDIMTTDVVFCEEDSALDEAVQIMSQKHIRRILVKDKNGALSGILSLGDILHRVKDESSLADLFKRMANA